MIEQFTEFWRSQTSRLMLIYLAIIMAMSLSYSGIIYFVSAHNFEQRIAAEVYIDESGEFSASERVSRYIKDQVLRSKSDLIVGLYMLNTVMLVFGAAFSFMLARWTLEPIERSVEAQTRFISDASHELRTPLTTMQLTNELALRRTKLTISEAREVIKTNIEETGRLQRMSTMLLDLVADNESSDIKPVAVNQVISGALSQLDSSVSKRKIKKPSQKDLKNLDVQADVDAATQALTILIDNAIKYSDPKTEVKIIAKKSKRSMIAIGVEDKGVGISKEDQKRIFTRFYRADQARKSSGSGGYGLGLEIAKRIAERHGGQIELASRPGKGSTFWLVLPEAKEAK